MLATTLLPLLALLTLPTFGLPVTEDEIVSASDRTCGRGGKIRIVHKTRTSTAVSSSTAQVQGVASSSTVEIASSASTAEPSPTTLINGGFAVQPTTAAPAPTQAPANNAPSGDASTLLGLHNTFRAKYGAGALTWNTELATYAANYASKCEFKHSGGPYGENLAAGAGGGYTVTSAFNAWAGEAQSYDWNQPGFSMGTGHFTQVVWKATTELGCAVVQCADGTIFSNMGGQKSSYVICEYKQPGNMVGNNGQYFTENVGRQQY